MGQGRGHMKSSKVRYSRQDLKVINLMWESVFSCGFKQNPRKPLEEMVTIAIGKENYIEAAKVAKSERYFNGSSVFYVSKSTQRVEIPRGLRPLLVLALYDARHSYSMEDHSVFISPLGSD